MKRTLEWYDKSYVQQGFKAQRLYPNEELLRFLGREFFSTIERTKRRNIKVLELGCGTCSNLWMIAQEGFNAYGIDISPQAIELGQQMLNHWKVKAELLTGSMADLSFEDNAFDVVFEVFSACGLCESDFCVCLDEVQRVLKAGGFFFSYSPSTRSDAFTNPSPSRKLDEFTLDGIKRETSPFFGNDYPFRFISPKHYRQLLEERGFQVTYLETVSRTYRRMEERFEFVTIVGRKLREV
tara:strand:+ start:643 stop:1359 length:717 start_codon:yes stop_codon:yes gene_type:complete